MKQELEKQLQEEFSPWFDQLYVSGTCMVYGTCVGDGWFPLIHQLCKDLKAAGVSDSFRVEQVKEKFGGLRFHWSGGCCEQIYELVNAAENESETICEECGTKENVTKEGSWIKTLCGVCRERLKKTTT